VKREGCGVRKIKIKYVGQDDLEPVGDFLRSRLGMLPLCAEISSSVPTDPFSMALLHVYLKK
jgi:hypothetical protein